MTRGRAAGVVLTHLLGVTLVVGVVVGVAGTAWGTVDQTIPGVILLAATVGTGWLLAVKLPRNPVGWSLLAITIFFVTGPLALLIGQELRATSPGLATWLLWYSGDGESNWAWLLAVWPLLIWVPLHFPDGRLPSARWRWFGGLTILLLGYAVVVFATTQSPVFGLPNPVGIELFQENQGLLLIPSALLAVVCFAGTVVSLVVRYRSGGVVVRAQLRWMVWAVALATAYLAVGWTIDSDAYDNWTLAMYALIPLAVAIAVLRYRLYEIDRIISRTAAYAIVTLVVVGTYLGVVLIASLVVGDTVGVAIGTLAAAGIFLPVLRWVRRGIDRVFNRAQYNAERVVVAFGEQIRNGADPHVAGGQLLAAVEASLAPSAVGLWVRR